MHLLIIFIIFAENFNVMAAIGLELKTQLLVAQRSIAKAHDDVKKVLTTYQKTGSWNINEFGLTRGDIAHLEEEITDVRQLADRLVKLIK